MFRGVFDTYGFNGYIIDFLNNSLSFFTESVDSVLRRLDGSTLGMVTPLGGRIVMAVIKKSENL